MYNKYIKICCLALFGLVPLCCLMPQVIEGLVPWGHLLPLATLLEKEAWKCVCDFVQTLFTAGDKLRLSFVGVKAI